MRITALTTVAVLSLAAAGCHKPAHPVADPATAKAEAAAASSTANTATTDAAAAPTAAEVTPAPSAPPEKK